MIEALSWILLGCLLGVFTGLMPGIHVNTIAVLFLAFSESNDLNIALLIVATSVVHSFVDFIPSILIGAQDTDSFLSVLPGHYFFLKGEGLYAIKLTAAGGIFSVLFCILLLPFFWLLIAGLAEFLYSLIPFILVALIALMVLSEKGGKKKWALATILLSGITGIIGLNSGSMQETLFPLVTGFFGSSTLVYSLTKEHSITEQKTGVFKEEKKTIIKGSFFSTVAGAIVSFFPSVGASTAAFLLGEFTKKISRNEFLVVLGGVNTANTIFSFAVLFLIGKARTGAAATVKQLIGLNETSLLLIFAAVLISASFGYIATDIIGKKAIKWILAVNYRNLSKYVLGLLFLLVLFLSGLYGMILFLVSTAIGLLPLSTGIKRTHCMAFLMFPTILLYLGFAA